MATKQVKTTKQFSQKEIGIGNGINMKIMQSRAADIKRGNQINKERSGRVRPKVTT